VTVTDMMPHGSIINGINALTTRGYQKLVNSILYIKLFLSVTSTVITKINSNRLM